MISGLRSGQVLPDGDSGRDGYLQHRDAPVEEPHRRRERTAGALQVGGGEDVADLLYRSGLEPPAAHAVGLDGGPAPVVVVEGPRRGSAGAHAAGEDSDLLGLPGVVGAAERDRHGMELRIAIELADHQLPFTGCAEHVSRRGAVVSASGNGLAPSEKVRARAVCPAAPSVAVSSALSEGCAREPCTAGESPWASTPTVASPAAVPSAHTQVRAVPSGSDDLVRLARTPPCVPPRAGR